MRRWLVLSAIASASAAVLSTPAAATAPSTEVVPIDFSFSPPLLSASCGFTVTRHVEGTLTIRSFVDASGSFQRELDQYRLVETVSANGQTLVARTIQNISTKLLADGSYTVSIMGTDFRLPVPGSGIAFGSVGRFVLHFAADNTLIDVLQDVGDIRTDTSAICGALAA